MILASQKGKTRITAPLIDSWAPRRDLAWVPTSSRRVLVTRVTESTLAAARSSIVWDSLAACSGVPWKRFLSLLSLVADQPGSDPLAPSFDVGEVISRARSRMGEDRHRTTQRVREIVQGPLAVGGDSAVSDSTVEISVVTPVISL
jgi:hypothetical protein